MKLVAGGASGFKIVGLTRKFDPVDRVTLFEALAARRPAPEEAFGLLSEAYASAGRFTDAVRVGKKARHEHTLQQVGEAALDAGAFADAAAAFSAMKHPKAVALVGLAVAEKLSGKSPKATLARAAKANVAKGPIDWKSATSCYEHVNIAIVEAMIMAVSGNVAAARRSLAARSRFVAVAQKSVRKECDDQLASPGAADWWGSAIARHAGLPASTPT